MVVAPSAMAARTTSATKPGSDRVASSQLNSTSSHSERASRTASTAAANTCWRSMRSLCVMWMSEVAMNVWMRGLTASRTPSQAVWMSRSWARASPAMTGPLTSRDTACTPSRSPGELMGKPASMTSTPSLASWWAISTFSRRLREMPGDCSPSRRVVSKNLTRLASSRGAASAVTVRPPGSWDPGPGARARAGVAARSPYRGRMPSTSRPRPRRRRRVVVAAACIRARIAGAAARRHPRRSPFRSRTLTSRAHSAPGPHTGRP